MDQGCQQVLKQVERMFKAGVKKFPQCTKLRISFAFFQLEHLKNKEKAYEEFSAASKLDPSFQQQFNIYRFKKIIRENL
jgi:protein involved in temperature-dependent protein secretion